MESPTTFKTYSEEDIIFYLDWCVTEKERKLFKKRLNLKFEERIKLEEMTKKEFFDERLVRMFFFFRKNKIFLKNEKIIDYFDLYLNYYKNLAL